MRWGARVRRGVGWKWVGGRGDIGSSGEGWDRGLGTSLIYISRYLG